MIPDVSEENITWEDFKRKFEVKFIPKAEKGFMLGKFIRLKQGEMFVSEYVTRFNELVRFGFEFINTLAKKARKFAKGLNSPIKELTLNQILHGATFENVAEATLLNSNNEEVVKE